MIPLKKRQHFLSFLERAFSIMLFLAVLLYLLIRLLSYDISLSGRFLYFQIPTLFLIAAGAAVYLFFVGGSLLGTIVTADKTGVSAESDFLSSRKTSIPYTHVHMYTVRQNIAQRIFKQARLQLGSGGKTASSEIDVTVGADAAAAIEDAIKRISCASARPLYEIGVQPRLIALYALLLPSRWLRPIGYLLTVITVIIGVAGYDFLPLILLYTSAAAISAAGSALTAAIKYRAYKITDLGCALLITYGKLTQWRHFVLKEHIDGILVTHNPLNLIARRFSARLLVRGEAGASDGLALPFLPAANKEQLSEAVNKVLPFLDGHSVRASKIKRAAPVSKLIFPNILLLPAAVFLIIYGVYAAAAAYILINLLLFADAAASRKNMAFDFGVGRLYCRKGGLFGKALLCRGEAVHAVCCSASPAKSKKKLVRPSFYLRSAHGAAFRMPYLDKSLLPEEYTP